MCKKICVCDVETNGLDCNKHEILQMALLPLTERFEVDDNIEPFCYQIKAVYPERSEQEALQVNKLDPSDGINVRDCKKLLNIWMIENGIDKIEPLGHNLKFDDSFLRHFFSHEEYSKIFHYHSRDSMAAARLINDRASYCGVEKVFKSCSLGSIAEVLEVDYAGAHDALNDCRITAEIYKKLLEL